MNLANIERATFTHRGLRLSYLDSAPADRTRAVILMLHGFPDEAQMWRPMIPALQAAGYRVIAPDTVGCGESEIAPRRADYDVLKIVGDHVALLDHLGIAQVHLVGHDWGAAVAWFFAMHTPQRLKSLCAMSVGHPAAYVAAGWKQKFMAWYIGYFHLAGVAERALLGHGRFSMRRVFGSHPQIEEVIARLSQRGRLTAALLIYRANIVPNLLFSTHPPVQLPVLSLHSAGDAFLGLAQMQNSAQHVVGPFRFEALSGGHWIPLEQPARATALLLDHLRTL